MPGGADTEDRCLPPSGEVLLKGCFQGNAEDGVEGPYQMMTGKIPPFASDRGGVFFSAVLSVIDELPHLSFQLGTQDLHNSESPRMR